MVKKTKTTIKQKQQHYFILKGCKGLYFKSKIQADFTPTKYQNNKPVFNRDRKYFTPSFIIPSLYQKSNSNYQEEHEDKIKSTQQKSEQNIFVPRPKPNKNYCGVCTKDYGDYLEHIKSQQHKKELRSSQFYNEITKLCQKFKTAKEQTKTNFIPGITSKSTLASDNHEQDETTVKQGISRGETHYRSSEGQAGGCSIV